MAQVAMQQGAYAANAIMRKVKRQPEQKPFKYFDKGNLAVIGRAATLANIFGRHLSGLPARLVWALVHLMYIVEFQSRIIVFSKVGNPGSDFQSRSPAHHWNGYY